MDCKDELGDKVFKMDIELLEDVEQPYLISLSDSQVSNREILSDSHSSGTFEVSSPSLNKAKEWACYNEHECLFEEKCASSDNKNDRIIKSSIDSIDSAFKLKKLKFNNREAKRFYCGFLKGSKGNSVSSSKLRVYSLDCICRYSKIFTYIKGCSINGFSVSKRCVSLPNLSLTSNQKMIYSRNRKSKSIPCVFKNSDDSFINLAIVDANEYSFEDFLIKKLLEKVHSLQATAYEKDVLISELMNSYDKLTLKFAEAENKIDRMRFADSMSEGLSSPSVSSLKHDEQGLINKDSTVPHEIAMDIVHDNSLTNETVYSRNFSLHADRDQRKMRKFEWTKNERDCKKKELIFEVNEPSVKMSDKKMTDFHIDASHNSDLDFHLCELENKLNLDKLEKDVLHHEGVTQCKIDEFSDKDMLSLSDDDSYLSSPKNHGNISTGNPFHSEKLLKNNFNNSYNKIISYAKAKRELASYQDFHKLIYERNENDSLEGTQNLDIPKVNDSFKKTTKEGRTILLSENKSIEVNDARNCAIVESDSNSESSVVENISELQSHTLLGNADSHPNEDFYIPKQSSGLLNNVFGQLNHSYSGEDKVIPKYFYSTNPDSTNKMSVVDLKKTNPIENKVHVDVKNYFGGLSCNDFSLHEKQLISLKVEETSEVESEISDSLGSVKLEACDCWNEVPFSQVISNHVHKLPSIEDKITISPFHLDLSSSDDYSLPLLGKDNQESDEVLKFHDDDACGYEKTKGMSQLQMKTEIGKLLLRDVPKKTAESMHIVVSSEYNQKKISQIVNSLNKIDAAASKLKHRTEGLKSYLSLQLNSLS